MIKADALSDGMRRRIERASSGELLPGHYRLGHVPRRALGLTSRFPNTDFVVSSPVGASLGRCRHRRATGRTRAAGVARSQVGHTRHGRLVR